MEGNGNTCQNRLVNGAKMSPKMTKEALLAKARAAIQSGECNGEQHGQEAAAKGNCETSSQMLESVYAEEDYDDTHTLIVTNGIPSHCYQNGQEYANPNWACEQYRAMLVPKNGNGKGSSYTENSMGPVGIAKSGAFLFNHKSAESSCNAAAISEKPNMDTCDGHAAPTGHYHYHSTPNHECVEGTDSCGHIGWLIDGVEVRGQCTIIYKGKEVPLKSCYKKKTTTSNGCDTSMYEYDPTVEDCNLDEANGFLFDEDTTSTTGQTFSAGHYAYFFTSNYPFLMPGRYGNKVEWCMISV